MEDYLDKLKNMIDSKKINDFCVFPDAKPFKIIKKNIREMKEILKKNPEKYADRHIASVVLRVSKKGLKKKEDIFSINIRVFKIYKDGLIGKTASDNWGLLLKYMPEDLEEHPFKMSDIKKMVSLVDKKYLRSEFLGIFYKEYLEDLDYIKERYGINESNRIKKSLKRTSKKLSKKRASKKRTSKQTKK